jgi:hypothetical protein
MVGGWRVTRLHLDGVTAGLPCPACRQELQAAGAADGRGAVADAELGPSVLEVADQYERLAKAAR